MTKIFLFAAPLEFFFSEQTYRHAILKTLLPANLNRIFEAISLHTYWLWAQTIRPSGLIVTTVANRRGINYICLSLTEIPVRQN